MNTHVLMLATANHERSLHARLLANVEVNPDRLTEHAIRDTFTLADEFRLASKLATCAGRQAQLLERVRVVLDVLADVEEDLMLAAGER